MKVPQDIQQVTETELAVRWADGHESYFSARALRQNCRCAACVNEVTGARMLNPELIREDIRLLHWEPVGHYGIRLHFSDGHATGIYSFSHLLELCP